jgi:uncharacterized protein YhdP
MEKYPLMKTLLRLLFPLILIPTAIVLLLGFAVWSLVPQSDIRKFVAGEIGKKINRQIEMGPLHLAWRGMEMDWLRVSNVPAFKAGTFFEAKGVRIRWSPRTLWQGLDLRQGKLSRSSGHIFVRDFRNPHYVAKDFVVDWSLTGLDSPKRLNGWAKLKQGAGALQNVDQLMARSPAAKTALAPVLAIMNLERAGILRLGLPDLRHWPIDSITGNYTFEDGLTKIKDFKINSPELSMSTTGTVDLPTGNLKLQSHLSAPNRGQIGALDADLAITGTTSKPQVDLTSLKKKAFKTTLNSLLRKL